MEYNNIIISCQKDMNHYGSREITGKDKNEQEMNAVCWNSQYEKLPEMWISVLKFPYCSSRHNLRVIFEAYVMNNWTKILLTDLLCHGWAKSLLWRSAVFTLFGAMSALTRSCWPWFWRQSKCGFLAEVSVFVGYGITSLGVWCSVFRDSIITSSLRLEKSSEETSMALLQRPIMWQVFGCTMKQLIAQEDFSVFLYSLSVCIGC